MEDQLELDEVVEQVRGLHEAGRRAMLAEIVAELEDALGAAESSDQAEGDERTWGRNEAPGLRSFLAHLRSNF